MSTAQSDILKSSWRLVVVLMADDSQVDVYVHKDVHAEEIFAVYLLIKYGSQAKIEPYLGEGALRLGIGGGPLDEHSTDDEDRKEGCCATLVAGALGVSNLPHLQQMLRFLHFVDIGKSMKGENTEADNSHPFDVNKVIKHGWRYMNQLADSPASKEIVNMTLARFTNHLRVLIELEEYGDYSYDARLSEQMVNITTSDGLSKVFTIYQLPDVFQLMSLLMIQEAGKEDLVSRMTRLLDPRVCARLFGLHKLREWNRDGRWIDWLKDQQGSGRSGRHFGEEVNHPFTFDVLVKATWSSLMREYGGEIPKQIVQETIDMLLGELKVLLYEQQELYAALEEIKADGERVYRLPMHGDDHSKNAEMRRVLFVKGDSWQISLAARHFYQADLTVQINSTGNVHFFSGKRGVPKHIMDDIAYMVRVMEQKKRFGRLFEKDWYKLREEGKISGTDQWGKEWIDVWYYVRQHGQLHNGTEHFREAATKIDDGVWWAIVMKALDQDHFPDSFKEFCQSGLCVQGRDNICGQFEDGLYRCRQIRGRVYDLENGGGVEHDLAREEEKPEGDTGKEAKEPMGIDVQIAAEVAKLNEILGI